MIQIGKYKLRFPQLSMIVVFIVLSACAVVAAFDQARPEWPLPLSHILLINEVMALAATLVYGILTHFIIAIINRFKA